MKEEKREGEVCAQKHGEAKECGAELEGRRGRWRWRGIES